MKPFSKIAAAAGLGLAAAAFAIAGGSSTLQKTLQAKYTKTANDCTHGNFKTLESVLDAKFVMKDDATHKTTSRAEFLKEVEKISKTSKKMFFSTKVFSLTSKGKKAVARVEYQVTTVYDKVGGKGIEKNKYESTAKDTWIKTPAGWKLSMSEILSSKIYAPNMSSTSLPKSGGHHKKG